LDRVRDISVLHKLVWFFTAFVSFSIIATVLERSQFKLILSMCGLLFLTYGLWFVWRTAFKWKEILFCGIVFRLIFLFSEPTLSDDIHRFLWDGYLLSEQINPYVHKPSEMVIYSDDSKELLHKMNSPEYYSLYPPVNQGIWSISWMGGSSNYSRTIVLRFIILLFEIATILLLRKILLHLNKKDILIGLYALNPLVIIELTGNLHPEVFMIFFLTLSLYLYTRQKGFYSALAFAGAICSKLIPVLLLPLLIHQIGWKKTIRFSAIALIASLLLFLPFWSPRIIENYTSSLGLYFGKFEFNGSFYYLFRQIGRMINGWNNLETVNALLKLIVISIIIILSCKKMRSIGIFEKMLFLLAAYFFFSPIVHPWYASTLILLSVFSHYRFALIWSATIFLSYAHYRQIPWQENYMLIGAEYLTAVGFLLFELWRYSRRRLVGDV
jgi:alpha-1,6-mannosyltransferase